MVEQSSTNSFKTLPLCPRNVCVFKFLLGRALSYQLVLVLYKKVKVVSLLLPWGNITVCPVTLWISVLLLSYCPEFEKPASSTRTCIAVESCRHFVVLVVLMTLSFWWRCRWLDQNAQNNQLKPKTAKSKERYNNS